MSNFYIQYHNADKLGYFPGDEINFNKLVKDITLKNEEDDDFWIYTSKKKSVEKSIGGRCFLIVGKTENKIKNYYLWSSFQIQDYQQNDNEIINVYGKGRNIKNPIFLNQLSDFVDFKKFCGNFGIGFQNITKHNFSQVLNSYITNLDNNTIIKVVSQELNKLTNLIPPNRKVQVIKRFIRNDRKIVNLLKESVGFKCQFPNCNSHIPDKNGINYVEVAHIKAFAEGGQSIIGNLIVLCPNHHKEFDLGNRNIFKQNADMISGMLNEKSFEISLVFNYSYKIK